MTMMNVRRGIWKPWKDVFDQMGMMKVRNVYLAGCGFIRLSLFIGFVCQVLSPASVVRLARELGFLYWLCGVALCDVSWAQSDMLRRGI